VANFTPGGKILPPEVKLKTGLRQVSTGYGQLCLPLSKSDFNNGENRFLLYIHTYATDGRLKFLTYWGKGFSPKFNWEKW
jgi:hypothetical protein